MSHRPFPNAGRALRYVHARHGDDCPRCGHVPYVHPRRKGQYVCRRRPDGMPSCRECAAVLRHRLATPQGQAVANLVVSVQQPVRHVENAVMLATARLRQGVTRRL